MPVIRFLLEFRFLLVQIYMFLFIFSPFFGCFGSNLRAFSCFPHQFQVFVSPERSSERDYVITDSVCSMCM